MTTLSQDEWQEVAVHLAVVGMLVGGREFAEAASKQSELVGMSEQSVKMLRKVLEAAKQSRHNQEDN